MNRFKTTDLGGLPLVLDDFRWMHDSLAEGFKGLASFLGTDFIINGCSLTGIGTATFNNTAGYVMLGGEVCYIAASAAPIDNTVNTFLYLEISSTFDITGTKTFEDSTPHSTYEIRRAIINGYTTAQAGKVSVIGLKTAKTLHNELIQDVAHAFTKTQSFAEGTATAVAAGVNVIPVNSNDEGNSFNLNIDDYNTALQRFNTAYPNGTWMAVTTVATSGVVGVTISDGSSLTNGIVTRGGLSYSFKLGETMLFLWSGGKARLMNQVRIAEPAQALSLEAGWNNIVTAKSKLSALGDIVTLTGQVGNNSYTTGTSNHVTDLAAGSRPASQQSFDIVERSSGGRGQLFITTGGVVSVYFEGMSADPVSFTLDGVSFSVL